MRVPRPLLSVPEVARLLDMSPATIYKLCADGELAHVRILTAIRIVPVDLACSFRPAEELSGWR